MGARRNLISLSLVIPVGTATPTEFMLFAAGWNDTDKGRFLFDAEAAQAVMSTYKTQGIDRMIDLEHLSLDDQAPNYDPDARGWAQLEVKPDGSLWAVNVTWTPDGAMRLAEKRQRYVSPTFLYDKETKRVSQLWNVAITAQPATHNSAPLVAASRGQMTLSREQLSRVYKIAGHDEIMNLSITMEQMQQIAEVMGLAPDAPLADIIAAFAGGAKELQDASNPQGAEDDAAPDSSADVASAEMADGPPPAQGAPPAKGAPPPKPEDKKAAMAASARIMRLANKPSLEECADEIAVWRDSYMTMETQRASLAKEKATLESAERRRLAAELVTLGAEFPATVWADDRSKTLRPHWAQMDLAALRSHVAAQRSARGAKKPSTGISPPHQEHVSLSASELAICKETGCEPGVYAQLKAFRAGGHQ